MKESNSETTIKNPTKEADNSEISNNAAKNKVDLDTILVNEIGQLGRFQMRMVALVGVLVIFVSFAGFEYTFTTARISTRCLIPECDEASPSFAPPWILNAIPGSSAASFESCERYTNTSSEVDQTCPASLFDQQATQPCDQYVYENTETIVYDFDLGCDEWRRSLIGSIRPVGAFFALPLTGYVSDRWGRRTALSINAFSNAWIGVTRYWANTYVGFAVSEFVEAVLGSGAYTTAYILVMELMAPQYRIAAGALINTFLSCGQILIALIAWVLPNWRQLTLALYAPQLITIAYFWISTESVRWLMSKGQYEKSEKILMEVARINKKELSQKSLEALRETAENEKRLKAMYEAKGIKEPWLAVLVYKNKPILLRCIILPVWWISATFVYYGLSINAVNMSGNKYVNYMAVAASEIPGYWTSIALMGVVGRKPVLMGSFLICAVCQVVFIFLPSDQYGASLAIYLVGKFSIAATVAANYVYTAELFPTRYRQSLYAFCSMIGRLGSILAPLTPALGATVWEHLPFALFGGCSLVSGLLVLLTPETLGCKLPDTIDEANQLGARKTH